MQDLTSSQKLLKPKSIQPKEKCQKPSALYLNPNSYPNANANPNPDQNFTLNPYHEQESLKLSSNSNCSSLALRLASEGFLSIIVYKTLSQKVGMNFFLLDC